MKYIEVDSHFMLEKNLQKLLITTHVQTGELVSDITKTLKNVLMMVQSQVVLCRQNFFGTDNVRWQCMGVIEQF